MRTAKRRRPRSAIFRALAHGPRVPSIVEICPRTDQAPVFVLCPMRVEFEAVRGQLSRAGADLRHVRLIQTGIGKAHVTSAVESVARQVAGGSVLFILAGACGGLVPTEDVPSIERVIDQHGHEWPCERWWRAEGGGGAASGRAGVTLVGVDEIIATPADKLRLARATGAAIVDMESHAFIQACERSAPASGIDVHWAIARGVSDTPEETLPERVLHWIDESGNTRPFRAGVDLITRPWLVPHIAGVLRRSRRVLPTVGRRVVEICSAWGTGASMKTPQAGPSEQRVGAGGAA